MNFDEFITSVDSAVAAHTAAERSGATQAATASWQARSRRATVALLEPRNVSVTLDGTGATATTTWYPIDPALVPVVANRIAGYLSEA